MPKKKSPNSVRLRNSTAEFLTFAYQTGGDGVEVRVENGTIWLSQKNMGLLFETTPENVLVHLKNIYAENELAELATANEFLAVQTEGKRQVQRSILHYTKIRLRLDFWKVARQRPVSGSAPASGAVGCAPRPKWRAFTGLRPHFFRSWPARARASTLQGECAPRDHAPNAWRNRSKSPKAIGNWY